MKKLRLILGSLLIITNIFAANTALASESCQSGLSDEEYSSLILGSWRLNETFKVDGHKLEGYITYSEDGSYYATINEVKYKDIELMYISGSWSITNTKIKHTLEYSNIPMTQKEWDKEFKKGEKIRCIGTTKYKDSDSSMTRVN